MHLSHGWTQNALVKKKIDGRKGLCILKKVI